MGANTVLCRYIATSDYKPSNPYLYAQEHGTREELWIFSDLLEALESLQDLETTCAPVGDGFLITCYALE